MTRRYVWVAAVAAVLILGGCEDPEGPCNTGATRSCDCPGGGSGTQACKGGEWGSCTSCTIWGGDGGVDAPMDGPGSDADGAGGDDGLPAGGARNLEPGQAVFCRTYTSQNGDAAWNVNGAAVPFADSAFALRFYSHIDGIEYEGKPTSTMRFEVGGQVLIQGLVSLELGVSTPILDARFGERRLRHEMRSLSDRFMRVEDKGALSVTFGISVLL